MHGIRDTDFFHAPEFGALLAIFFASRIQGVDIRRIENEVAHRNTVRKSAVSLKATDGDNLSHPFDGSQFAMRKTLNRHNHLFLGQGKDRTVEMIEERVILFQGNDIHPERLLHPFIAFPFGAHAISPDIDIVTQVFQFGFSFKEMRAFDGIITQTAEEVHAQDLLTPAVGYSEIGAYIRRLRHVVKHYAIVGYEHQVLQSAVTCRGQKIHKSIA